MESSKHFIGREGCSSSESGWTMYIASPVHEGDSECSGNDDDGNNIHNTNYNNYGDGKDEGSDDSMASDASSGPNHHEQACENGQDSHGTGMAPFKHDRGDNINKYSSWKKAKKQEKKKGGESSSKKEKKDLVLRRNSASSHTLNVGQGK